MNWSFQFFHFVNSTKEYLINFDKIFKYENHFIPLFTNYFMFIIKYLWTNKSKSI